MDPDSETGRGALETRRYPTPRGWGAILNRTIIRGYRDRPESLTDIGTWSFIMMLPVAGDDISGGSLGGKLRDTEQY